MEEQHFTQIKNDIPVTRVETSVNVRGKKYKYKIHGGLLVPPEKEARWSHFGQYIINTNMLSKNILLVKYASYRPIAWCGRQDITPAFSQLLNDLLVTATLNYGLLKQMPLDEQALFRKLATASKIPVEINEKLARVSNGDVRERFDILKGELLSGNDSEIIRKEMRYVLNQLVRMKKLSEEEKTELMEELG